MRGGSQQQIANPWMLRGWPSPAVSRLAETLPGCGAIEPAARSEAFFVRQQARNGSQRLPFAHVAARTRRTLRNQEGYRRHAYDRNWADSSRDADRSLGIAVAQTSTTTSPSSSATSSATVKCWDSVTKQVRNETPSTSTGSSTKPSTSSTGTSTSSTTTGSTGSTSSPTRPAEAAGLPDCRH